MCVRALIHSSTSEDVSLGQSHCPICYTPLEARDVTPCYICGGWPEVVARFDQAAEYIEFRLPMGRTLLLCRDCELEEFMVPGGWGYQLAPSEKLPVNALQRKRATPKPHLARDKFCPTCNLRLAFLDVIAASQSQADLD